MRTWYLVRNGVQSGPFSAQELLNMLAQGRLFPQDVFIDSKNGRRYALDKAIKKWRKSSGFRPKKKRTGLLVFLVIVLLIGGFIGFKYLTKKSDNLTLGNQTHVASDTVSPDGGAVTVTGTGLDGFEIDVPAGAYIQDTNFDISTRPIESHKFGDLFDPVTPLITIDNSDVFADESVTVTIPIEKSDDEFAMGFFYDEKTGELEGIPLISLDNDHITLLTNHFCEIVVSKVKIEDLKDLDIDTGFFPGYDDWQFTNYGSYIAPGGHCAGQSITAMWYFQEKYEDLHYPRLYGEFDNYDYGITTRSFWRDDSLSYRFASVIQDKIDWAAKSYKIQKHLSNTTSPTTMYAFIYAMKITGEPQFVEVWGKTIDEDGNPHNAGHAIIAYAIENGNIYVCDPNYPGVYDRKISFSGMKFNTYSSGSNAAAIEAGNDIAFTDIYYIAQSALIDYSVIDAEYEKMIKGTVGDDLFPECSLYYLKSIDKDGNLEWAPLPAELNLNSADNVKNLGEKYRDKLRIAIATPYNNLNAQLYSGLNDAKIVETKMTNDSGQAFFIIKLTPGINDLGFYIYHYAQTRDYFMESTRLNVEFDLTAEMKFEKDPYNAICQNEMPFTVTVKNAPPDIKYIWDFGDGNTVETEIPETKYTYTQSGDYVITCTMIKNSDGKVLAETRAVVKAVEIYGSWDFSYEINESKAVDSIINFIIDMFLKMFQQIFPDNDIPDTIDFSLVGTVVDGKLNVYMSEDDDFKEGVYIELEQTSASEDYVEVDSTPIPGYLQIGDDNQIILDFYGTSEGSDISGAMTFKGFIYNGVMYGTFNIPGAMSGEFNAKRQ